MTEAEYEHLGTASNEILRQELNAYFQIAQAGPLPPEEQYLFGLVDELLKVRPGGTGRLSRSAKYTRPNHQRLQVPMPKSRNKQIRSRPTAV